MEDQNEDLDNHQSILVGKNYWNQENRILLLLRARPESATGEKAFKKADGTFVQSIQILHNSLLNENRLSFDDLVLADCFVGAEFCDEMFQSDKVHVKLSQDQLKAVKPWITKLLAKYQPAHVIVFGAESTMALRSLKYFSKKRKIGHICRALRAKSLDKIELKNANTFNCTLVEQPETKFYAYYHPSRPFFRQHKRELKMTINVILGLNFELNINANQNDEDDSETKEQDDDKNIGGVQQTEVEENVGEVKQQYSTKTPVPITRHYEL